MILLYSKSITNRLERETIKLVKPEEESRGIVGNKMKRNVFLWSTLTTIEIYQDYKNTHVNIEIQTDYLY